jgi:hypothetical protein
MDAYTAMVYTPLVKNHAAAATGAATNVGGKKVL